MTEQANDHRPASASRLERYAVGTGTLASLLAGRATFRLVQAATTVLLLPVWGADQYGTYAGAMATFGWVIALTTVGPEKTVLKLLPRAPRTGPMVTSALLAVLWWLPLPLVATFLLVLARTGAGTASIYIGVAAMHLCMGCTLLLVGLHRAHGRPRLDAFTFLAMTTVQLALLSGAVAGALGPVGYISGVITAQLVLNVILATALGRPSLALRHRPRFLRRLAWTTVLLGAPDLYLYASTAVLFIFLTASPWADQVGLLYAVLIVFSAAVNLLLYVFRVFAPRTSLTLAGRAGPAGRRRAARLAGRLTLANALWLAVVAVIAGAGLLSSDTTTGQVVVWVLLMSSRTPIMAGVLWASYRMENTDATAPRVLGIAACVGLAVCTIVGLVTVPFAGALGVIISVGAGELAFGAVVATGGGRRAVMPAAADQPDALLSGR